MSHQDSTRIFPALVMAVGSGYVFDQNQPLIMPDGEPNMLAAAAAGFFLISGSVCLVELLRFIGNGFDILKVKTPKRIKGSAGWVKKRRQIWRELIWRGFGPYWGTLNKKPVFSSYESVSLTCGPPGASKTVGVVMPTILSIRGSKVVPDFSGELAATLARPLRERGEEVIVVNVGEILSEYIGEGKKLNPLGLIVDNLWRPGGLKDMSDDSAEFALQVSPEQPDANKDNEYFRIGARDLIEFAIQICILIKGDAATLGDVLQMLLDRESLLRHALWIAGRLEVLNPETGKTEKQPPMPIEDGPWVHKHDIEDVLTYKTYLGGLGSAIADLLLAPDSRMADPFLTGARQALRRFNITTRSNKVTSETHFRFSELKDKPMTIILVPDVSRINAQKDVMSLLQWVMLQELKRHERKNDVPVHFIIDECTNYYINDLQSLMTWGRKFGIRIHIIIQFISEFRQVYGSEALKTLLNVAEIIQWLPGQSESETLKLIQDMLSEESIIAESYNGQGPFSKIGGIGYSEVSKPLMTTDEIRRTKKTILFIRQQKPMLVDVPPISAISPFRKQIDINPYYGKQFLSRIRLRLEGRNGPWLWRVLSPLIKGMFAKSEHAAPSGVSGPITELAQEGRSKKEASP